MIRIFVDGQRMGSIGGHNGASCRLRLDVLSVVADSEQHVYGVTFEAKEARIVTSDGGRVLQRVLLLDSDCDTIANFVNLDMPAEALAAALVQAFKDGDPVTAVERLLGGQR